MLVERVEGGRASIDIIPRYQYYPSIFRSLQAFNFSRIQGAYWELLSNMASGVHVCGLHSSAFLAPFMRQRNYATMYSWADAYIGLHASPLLAPGAWVAFRPAQPEGQTPAILIGDYSFLMQRQLGEEGDSSLGLVKCGTSWEPGDFSTPYGAWCRSLPPGGVVSLVPPSRHHDHALDWLRFDLRVGVPILRLTTRSRSSTPHSRARSRSGPAGERPCGWSTVWAPAAARASACSRHCAATALGSTAAQTAASSARGTTSMRCARRAVCPPTPAATARGGSVPPPPRPRGRRRRASSRCGTTMARELEVQWRSMRRPRFLLHPRRGETCA